MGEAVLVFACKDEYDTLVVALFEPRLLIDLDGLVLVYSICDSDGVCEIAVLDRCFVYATVSTDLRTGFDCCTVIGAFDCAITLLCAVAVPWGVSRSVFCSEFFDNACWNGKISNVHIFEIGTHQNPFGVRDIPDVGLGLSLYKAHSMIESQPPSFWTTTCDSDVTF